jgi:hypothetical protein
VRIALASLVLVMAVAATGCSDTSETPAANRDEAEAEPTAVADTGVGKAFQPLTDAERAWVRRYAAWRDRFGVPLAKAEGIRERWLFLLLDPAYEHRPVEEYTAVLPRVGRCLPTLDSEAGRPPGSRLAEAYDLLRQGCTLLAGAAESDAEAIAGNDPRRFETSEEDWEEGILRLEKGDEAVQKLLLDRRPLPTIRGVSSKSRVEPVLGDVITRVVVENQEVRCWSERDWPIVEKDVNAYTNGAVAGDLLGVSSENEPLHLAPAVCASLGTLAYGKRRPDGGRAMRDLARAVVVLAHESEHSLGTVNEAVVECRAIQRIRKTARLLGAGKPYADRLAAVFWKQVYPYLPPRYRTPRCRDGGRLDLRPESRVWP